jgi:hypothetical protein
MGLEVWFLRVNLRTRMEFGSELLSAVTRRVPCSTVNVNLRFGGTYHFHRQESENKSDKTYGEEKATGRADLKSNTNHVELV